MRHEIGIAQPEYLITDWPGKYEVFSWLEYVVTVPNPIFIITTRKANGASNANLQSWGLLLGEKDNYSSLVAVLDHNHTYANILREGEWCVCFPTYDQVTRCFETINCNGPDNDEIKEAGFTAEPAKTVQAARIAECPICLECRLEWHRPLYEGSRWHLFTGRVLHLAMDETAMAPDPIQRMQDMPLMYNIRSTVNPLTGMQYGPNTLGLLNKVDKSVTEQGDPDAGRN